MKKPALFIHGRIKVGSSHLEAFQQLSALEQQDDFISGFFDPDTEEFFSDLPQDHFYDKEIFLIRHATPQDNFEDPDLSENGRNEAKKIAKTLENFDISNYKAICSPFLRCLRTAEILQESLGIQFRITSDVAEFFPKQKICNRKDHFPQFLWDSSEDWEFQDESDSDFQDRTKKVLQHSPSRCIMVTHYGFICRISQIALCPEKVSQLIMNGIPPGTITFIQKNHASSMKISEKVQVSIRKM